MKNVFVVLVVLVLACVGFVATRPSRMHIERTASIAAPPDVVYAQVADFHKWEAWSPWEKLDPAMKRTFEGAESGTGAVYAWTGNDKVGTGRMTVLEAVPPQKLGIRLEFIKPWQATNQATFTFTGEGPTTRVTWAMDGTNGFMAKAMGVFMNMDKLVGGDFERGLANLKTVSESEAAKAASAAPVSGTLAASSTPTAGSAH